MSKNIKSSDRIVILVILLIVVVPIFIHQMKLLNESRMKKTVTEIAKVIGKNDKNEVVKYDINNEFFKKNKIDGIKGTGIAFVDTDDSVTVIFGYKDRCAIKFSFDDKVYLQNKKCDNFELLKGIKAQIVTSGDGLYKIDDDIYRYQGYNVNNYLKYSNMLWRIMEISNNGMKMVSENAITSMKFEKNNIYNYLNEKFYNVLNKDLKKKIELLSINDIVSSSISSCKVINYISCPDKSYLMSESTWLKDVNEEKGWYLYTDGNIYLDNVDDEKNVRAVVNLNENIKVVGGNGTSNSPFIINETILGE
ncbi:MAG: hypothetical protein ACM3O4_02105 [Ignavibacteriales bacterium]